MGSRVLGVFALCAIVTRRSPLGSSGDSAVPADVKLRDLGGAQKAETIPPPPELAFTGRCGV